MCKMGEISLTRATKSDFLRIEDGGSDQTNESALLAFSDLRVLNKTEASALKAI